MAATSNATPLIALDAVVIDTETTGLDPAKARVVEIGAVPHRARPPSMARRRSGVWSSRACRYPPRPSRVHGIDDAALADAPPFAEVVAGIRALSSATRS